MTWFLTALPQGEHFLSVLPSTVMPQRNNKTNMYTKHTGSQSRESTIHIKQQSQSQRGFPIYKLQSLKVVTMTTATIINPLLVHLNSAQQSIKPPSLLPHQTHIEAITSQGTLPLPSPLPQANPNPPLPPPPSLHSDAVLLSLQLCHP